MLLSAESVGASDQKPSLVSAGGIERYSGLNRANRG